MKNALILIDWINDIMHPDGKLASHGYPRFDKKYGATLNAAKALSKARERKWLIIHVKVAFDSSYSECPSTSPLFGQAQEYQALLNNAWGTEFIDQLAPADGEYVLTKKRVNPFHGTEMSMLLHNNMVSNLYISGVSTDLSVNCCARDAHDRDYTVTVLTDACAAADEEDHNGGLYALEKFAFLGQTANL
jgi:nicotinamidase-related amidase